MSNDFSFRYLVRLATFVMDREKNVVNLSRIDPFQLTSREVGDRGSRMVYIRDRKRPALCVSLIVVGEDHTETPKVSGETYSKFITGTPLMLEFERMVAVLCMVHDVDSLRAQIVENELTFSTRMGTSYHLYYFCVNNLLFRKIQPITSKTYSKGPLLLLSK